MVIPICVLYKYREVRRSKALYRNWYYCFKKEREIKIILLYLSVFAPVAKVYKSDENNYQTEEYSQENLLTDILVR